MSGSPEMSTVSSQQGGATDVVQIPQEQLEQLQAELDSTRQQRQRDLAEKTILMRQVEELKALLQQAEEKPANSLLREPTDRWLRREQTHSVSEESCHVVTETEANVYQDDASAESQQPQALLNEENVAAAEEGGAAKAVKVDDQESEKMCNIVFCRKVASRVRGNVFSVMPHSLLTAMTISIDPKHERLRFCFATGGQRCNLPKLGAVCDDFHVAVADDQFGEGIFPSMLYELNLSCRLGNLVSLGTNWTAQDNTYPLTFLDNQLQEPIDFQLVRHDNSDADAVVRIGVELRANQLVGCDVCVLSANGKAAVHS